MMQIFRGQLGNVELVQRLYATADKTGPYANRDIYGQGMMDLGAATNPWGSLAFTKSPQGCLTTSDGEDCLSNAEFSESIEKLTSKIKAASVKKIESDFRNNQTSANAAMWPLDKINAYRALGHLELTRGPAESAAPGKGVTIGFVDTGIHESHHVFESSPSITEVHLRNAENEKPNTFSHGTAVAGIAAGRYGASGANIKMFAIPLGSGSGPYTPITLEQISGIDTANEKLYSEDVLTQDLDILNLSIGFSGGILRYTEDQLRNNYSKTIAAFAQADKQDKTIIVRAAGNARSKKDNGAESRDYSSPEILAGLPVRIEELQGHSIAVISIKEDGTISDFSNRCGIAKDFCIAAPGQAMLVAYQHNIDSPDTYAIGNGTSYSAPIVSGGLAIMKQLFRQGLSSEQLVSRLFATANKDGIYAQDDIYGQGLMDLGAATSPWGHPAFMGTEQSIANAVPTSMNSSFVTLGTPLGDGLARSLQSEEIAAFDSLGAPFWFQASQFTVPAAGTSIAKRLQHFLNPVDFQPTPDTWQFSFQENASYHGTGHMVLTDGAFRFTMASPQGISTTFFHQPQVLEGLAFSYAPSTDFTIQAGYLNEYESLLGSHANGAFGTFSGDTLFLNAGLNTTVGGWQLGTYGEIGWVHPSIASSQLIDGISNLFTSAFRLEASRSFFATGSTLRFSLSQPLRVESGSAALSFPNGRTQDGVVIGKSFSSSLAPSGRQLDLTAQLDMPFLDGELSLRATRSSQLQHQLESGDQWSFFTGYRTKW